MQPFVEVSGIAAPLPMANVDTDVIMPKQFLKTLERRGLAIGVMHDLRFDPAGDERPEFVLNRDPWRAARFLIAGPNFGCGSSREHAVWGLCELGIRAVVSESFGGIFFDNCLRNGLLAVTLPRAHVAQLMAAASDPQRCGMRFDLNSCEITAPGAATIRFDIDALRRSALLAGRDAIGETLAHSPAIAAFEAGHRVRQPWLFRG